MKSTIFIEPNSGKPKKKLAASKKNMTKNFCYRCAADTYLLENGKKSVCSKCGLTELQAKKYVNTEVKLTQNSQKFFPKIQEAKIDSFCHACNQIKPHDSHRGKLWCDTCGRDETAAKSFAAISNTLETKNENYTNQAIIVATKATLLITLFPFSLLFLVWIYGF